MGNAGRVLMIPKGDYNPATPYEMLDCVYYNGRSYVCKQASTGHAPTDTTYWQPMTPDASAEIQALTNEVRGNWATGGVNLFDPSQAIDGYIRDTNGEVGDAPNSKSTGYIAVVGGARYTITTTQTGSKWGAWYDSSKNFISGIKGNDYDNLTAPSNAAFMRLTLQYDGNNPNWATTTQIEKGSTATPYQPYAKTNVELTHLIKKKTATVTTSGSGNASIATDLVPYSAQILAINVTSGVENGAIAVAYKNLGASVNSLHVWAVDGTALANTTNLGIEVIYIDGADVT